MMRFLAHYDLPVREFSFAEVKKRPGRPRTLPDARKLFDKHLLQQTLVSLNLYAHTRQESALLFEWEASAQIRFDDRSSVVFLGLAASWGVTHSDLLRFLYESSKAVTNWAYGIAYLHPALRGADLYSVGMGGGVVPPEGAKKTKVDSQQFQDRLGAWFLELRHKRRHLQGWFRDVYPANLVTDLHVHAPLVGAKTLLNVGLGQLIQLDSGIWLWELTTEELPLARDELNRAGLITCP
jgi:hypothetical protein